MENTFIHETDTPILRQRHAKQNIKNAVYFADVYINDSTV
jgi:hypothetical protein